MRFFRNITRRFRQFHLNEDGNATVEFVLLFPLYMWVFVSSIESGLMMTRNAMLERGVDLVVRELKLNTTWKPDEDDLKRTICDVGGMFDNCEDNLRIEVHRINPRNPVYPSPQPTCKDRRDAPIPPDQSPDLFASVGQNELVMLRVCALIDPIIPNYKFSRVFFAGTEDEQQLSMLGLGSMVPLQAGGGLALVVTTMYVSEPL